MNRFRRNLINVLTSILVVIIACFSFMSILLIVFNFTHVKTDVYQFSMYPTLNANVTDSNEAGDMVYINKYAPIKNHDIVVANVSWNAKPVIKRLVALPGDTMRIEENANDYSLYINDELFYAIGKTMKTPSGDEESTRAHFESIRNYILLHGEDGVWTLDKDEYFLLGDNWVDSNDSSQHGPVKRNQIIGAVDVIIHKGENKINTLLFSLLKLTFSF